jgi:exopolysaccharide production protein ExoZ
MVAQKFRSLQILRAIATTMVALLHAVYPVELATSGQWSGWFTPFLAAGVDIFFVLSGAIIYSSAFAGRRGTATAFLARRFRRIAPMFYVTTLFVVLIGLSSGVPAWRRIAASISFWPVWGSGQLSTPILPAGWTLCFEMLFYAGAAIALTSRRAMPFLLGGFIAAWLIRDLTEWPLFQFLGNPITVEFLLGVMIARHFNPRKPKPIWFGALCVSIGFAALWLFVQPPALAQDAYGVMTGDLSLHRLFFWGIPAAFILYGAMLIEPYAKRSFLSPFVYIGDASYSIYLVHAPVIVFAYALFAELGITLPPALAPIAWCLLAAIGIGGGILAYELIERPIARAVSGRWRASLKESPTQRNAAQL